MPITYRGTGSPAEVNIFLYGDGNSKLVDVDLSKAPFCLDFKGNIPSGVFLVGEQSTSSSSYPDLVNVLIYAGTPPSGRLLLEFESPLPAVIYGPATQVGGASPLINLIFRFAYGGVVAETAPAS